MLQLVIFVASCAKNTPLQNNICAPIICKPVYGQAEDWVVISDDLARNIYQHNKMCDEINQK